MIDTETLVSIVDRLTDKEDAVQVRSLYDITDTLDPKLIYLKEQDLTAHNALTQLCQAAQITRGDDNIEPSEWLILNICIQTIVDRMYQKGWLTDYMSFCLALPLVLKARAKPGTIFYVNENVVAPIQKVERFATIIRADANLNTPSGLLTYEQLQEGGMCSFSHTSNGVTAVFCMAYYNDLDAVGLLCEHIYQEDTQSQAFTAFLSANVKSSNWMVVIRRLCDAPKAFDPQFTTLKTYDEEAYHAVMTIDTLSHLVEAGTLPVERWLEVSTAINTLISKVETEGWLTGYHHVA